jgi:hypothetical protein
LKQEKLDQPEQQRQTRRRSKVQVATETQPQTNIQERGETTETNETNENSINELDQDQNDSQMSIKKSLQSSGDAVFEQFRSYEELQQNMVLTSLPPTRFLPSFLYLPTFVRHLIIFIDAYN